MPAQNLEVKDIRTKDGNIRFGHIHPDETKSSIMMQGQGGLEFISIEQVGKRPGWIWSRCRGRYQIICGDQIKKDEVAFLLNVSGQNGLSQGNIEIVTKGRFKVQAENIELISQGSDIRNGGIYIQSNEQITLESKQVNIKAKELLSLYGSDITTSAINIMKLTAGSFEKLSNASALKKPKLPVNKNSVKAVSSSVASIF